MEQEHLHLLIHEQIFRLKDDVEKPKEMLVTNVPMEETEVTAPKIATPEKAQASEEQTASKVLADKHETPDIPDVHPVEIESLPFAVFHDSTEPKELELIHKIIAACQLDEEGYKIFGNGFDQSVQFQKALVFVPTAKSYYEPIPYKGSYFLCSQPASVLMQEKQQKAQLWEALQKFLDLQ